MKSQLYRPIGIILLAVNYLLIGGFGTLLLPLFLWTAQPAIHELISQTIHPPALSMVITCVIMALWAGGYIVYALLGYGMLRMRLWAWKGGVIAHWFVLGFSLIAIAIAARFDWILSLSIGAFCLLWIGGILHYLYRPRVRWSFEAATAIYNRHPIPDAPPPNSLPTWKIATIVLTVAVIGVTVFVVGLLTSIEKSFRSSTAYAMALDRAQASPCVARTLGQPFIAKGSISGNLSTNNDTGEADLEIPVQGPKSSGSLHVEAKKITGSWTINSLTLEHSHGQIQLAPVASACD